ncbi:MAG: hypothetical protein ACLGH0_02640, partial [Thermoanaerobaculia bacterium]
MRPLVLLFVLLAATALSASDRVEVPRAPNTPKVDGDVNATEWKNAVRVRLTDGAHALMQHNGTYLYIAIVDRHRGIGSICTTKGND